MLPHLSRIPSGLATSGWASGIISSSFVLTARVMRLAMLMKRFHLREIEEGSVIYPLPHHRQGYPVYNVYRIETRIRGQMVL